MSSSEDDEIPVIVIDAGSGSCKGGFAGENAPFSYFTSVVGIPMTCDIEDTSTKKLDTYVGDKAQARRDRLLLRYPIERGVVTDWDNAEKLFDFVFQDLKVQPKGRSVLMSEPPLNPVSNREKMTQLMFEYFNVDEFHMNSSSTLGIFAYGRSVGMIVDIGDGLTTVNTNYEIFSFHDTIQRQEFAGRDITHALQRLLVQKGFCFSTNSELDFLSGIKEEFCFTALDVSKNKLPIISTSKDCFTLPDGNIVELRDERYLSAEALFNPGTYASQDLRGLHELVYDCFMDLHVDVRDNFYGNILLTGGTSLMLGLPERLEEEMRKLMPGRKFMKVVACPERKYSCWIGGSILGSLSTYKDAPMTRAQYEEFGPSLAHRKFD